MSTSEFYGFLNELLNESEKKEVMSALRQDSFLFTQIQTPEHLQNLITSRKSFQSRFTPGVFALAGTHPELMPSAEKNEKLAPELLEHVLTTFEGFKQEGTRPERLETAVDVALAMIEKRKIVSHWKMVLNDVFKARLSMAEEDVVEGWKTILLIASQLDGHGNEILETLSHPEATIAQWKIFVHCVMAQPLPASEKISQLANALSNHDIRRQLEALRAIQSQAGNTFMIETARDLLARQQGSIPENPDISEIWQNTGASLQETARLQMTVTLAQMAGKNATAMDYLKAAEGMLSKTMTGLDLQKVDIFKAMGREDDANQISQKIINECSNDSHVMTELALAEYSSIGGSETLPILEKDTPLAGLVQAKTIESKGNQVMARETASDALKAILKDHEVLATAIQPRFSQNLSLEKLFDLCLQYGLDEEAVEIARTLLSNHPSDLNLIQKSAPLFYRSGYSEEALDLYETLSFVDPGSADHLRYKAKSLEALGKDEEAFETWKSLEDPQEEDRLHLASTASRTGNLKAAIDAASTIPDDSDHYGKALLILGKVFKRLGDREQAIHYLSKAVETEVDQEEPWLALADLYAGNGEIDQSIETLRTAKSVFPESSEISYQLARHLLSKDSPSEALIVLNDLTNQHPDYLPGQVLTVKTMKALNHEGVESKMEALVRRFPDSAEVNYLQGQQFLDAGQLADARKLLEKAVSDNNPDPEWLVAYADALAGDHYESAAQTKDLQAADQAVALNALKRSGYVEVDPLASAIQAEILLSNHQAEEAFRVLSSVVSKQVPADNGWYWRLQAGFARAAAVLGKFNVALASIQEAINQKPGMAGLYQVLADICSASGDTLAAVEAANQVLTIAPDVVENVLWFASFLTGLGHQAEAEKELQKAIGRRPDEVQYRLAMADLFARDNRLEEVRKTLEDVDSIIRSQPDEIELVHAAELYLQADDCKGAEAILKSRQERFPSSLQAALDLAGLLTSCGQLEESAKLLDQAVITEPGNAAPLLIKAELLYQKNDFVSSLEWTEKLPSMESSEICSHQSQFLPKAWNDLLAQANPAFLLRARNMYALGQFDGVIETCKKWLKEEPANPWAEFYLTEAQQADGMLTGKQPQPIASIAPSVVVYAHAQRLLDAGEVSRASEMVNRIQGDTDEEWEGVIRSQAASAQGELIEADVNASGIDVNTNKSTKWVKAEDIIRVQGFIKASLARWHWNDAVEMAANLYQSNMENVGNAALYLETIARAAEAVVNTRGLEIKKHIVDAELLLRSKSDFEEISAGLENTKSEEVKRWSLRGKLAFEVNEPEIRALAGITPQPGDIAAMVSALHRKGEEDKAVQVAKPFEGHPQVLNALGRCLKTNDATRAQAVLERSLKIADGQPEIWAEKSMLDERLGEKEFAIQSMENALSYWTDETEWHIRAAYLWQDAGDIKKAMDHLRHAFDLDPQNTELQFHIGNAYLGLNQTREAIQALELASSNDLNRADILESLAEAYYRNAEPEKAGKTAEKAGIANPFSVKPILLNGEIALEKGDTGKALEYARQAISRDEKNADAITFLAKVLVKRGDKVQALAALEKAATGEGATLDLMLKHAHLVREIKGSANSKSILEGLVAKYPQNIELLKLLAESQYDCGEKIAAEETSRHSLHLEANHPDVHGFLGKLKYENGNLDQAVFHYSQQIALDPQGMNGYLDLAKVYQQQRDYHKALETLQQAIQVSSHDSRPYVASASLLKEAKDYASAETMLRKAAAIDPNDVNIKRQLGAVIALNLVHKSQQASSQL